MMTNHLKLQGTFSVYIEVLLILTCIFTTSLITQCYGQSRIYLQHQLKPDRQINISLNSLTNAHGTDKR
jgi:hypothetical protein